MAETLMTEHSVYIAKSTKSFKPKEIERKNEMNTEEKGILNTNNDMIEDQDLELLNAEELKTMVRSMSTMQSKFKKEIKDLLDKNEKRNCLLGQNEEIDQIEKKDMKQVINSYKEKTKELMNLKEINKEIKKNEMPFESQITNKLKNKTPDNSPPHSIDSSHEIKDFSKKWLRGETYFNKGSKDIQFLFKNMEIEKKTNIKHINVEIKNIASIFISLEDIGIVSSESKRFINFKY